MGTRIFLGKPPAKIEQWIKDHYGKKYLTIEPMSSATPDADKTSIILRNSGSSSLTGTFEARLNDGAWTTVSWEDVSHGIDYNLVKACDASKETISFGEKLQIRGLDKWNSASNYSYPLKMKVLSDAGAKVYGKLADSLTPEYAASEEAYKLCYFFSGSTGLKDASGLDLGDIAIADYCYNGMFYRCTSLTQAPALPATTLAGYCYNDMFSGCTSLTQAPALPATTLADRCYTGMFKGCASLTQAPALPATMLADGCYFNMFWDCTSLTQAPALPATALAGNCYLRMFYGCTSLTQAPALPATTLAGNCYSYMFNSCTKVAELHYPASVQNDSTFTGMTGTPWFGATNATVHYDL